MNQTVNKRGELVMGKGCALEAKKRFPRLPIKIPELWKMYGVGVIQLFDERLFVFVVKDKWQDQAKLQLIEESAKSLNWLAYNNRNETFVLPRPGCGAGGLRWSDVRPLIEFLPDNVQVITPKIVNTGRTYYE